MVTIKSSRNNQSLGKLYFTLHFNNKSAHIQLLYSNSFDNNNFFLLREDAVKQH